MSQSKYYFSFFHAYATNMFLLYFVVLFINTHNGKTPSTLSFILLVIAILLCGWCVVHYFSLRYIYILLPIILAAALMLDFHWLSALLVSYLPILRMEYLYDDLEATMADLSIIITFLLLIAVSVFQTEATSEYMTLYHILLITQILFHFVGRIIYLLFDNAYSWRRRSIIFLTCFSVFITLGVALSFAYRYAVFAAQYIVFLLLSVTVFILRPFFSFLETVELEMPDLPDSETTEQQGEEQTEIIQEESLSSNYPFDSILMILLVLLLGAGLYYYYRKRSQPSEQHKAAGNNSRFNTVDTIRKEKSRKAEVPHNKVRKLYFEFERWLASKGMGRYRNETIDEWIGRCQLQDIIESSTLETYRRTRYMSKEVPNDEYKVYRQTIEKMKKEIINDIKKRR
ncbi:hypothetical protein FO441_07110 [Salinicoccus cyprini]|uniref:DUF4129 domain-containing protein n=1 Tax=Salinicoccus cyprini TaxID=2493691 RepID=A0A558AV82_9STAP|nr:hypothetical protein [Salinicoccus cyprini]TVT28174.1 hypothetical protein FO441_07110 [Salinicoccus cyprini]